MSSRSTRGIWRWRHALIAGALVLFCMLLVDPWFARWVRAWPDGLVGFFRQITDLGRSHWVLVPTGVGGILFAILATRVGDTRARQALASVALVCGFVFVAVASTGLLTSALKYLIGRARPKLMDEEGALGFAPFGLDADFASFPSGHTNTAVAIAVCLSFLWPRLWLPLAGFALAIAISRVVVGAHYPSDVIAGGYLAIITTYAWRRAFAGERLVFTTTAGGAVEVRGARIRRWMRERFLMWLRTADPRHRD